MKPKRSSAGVLLLREQLGLPVYTLEEAAAQLPAGSPLIYPGWIHASHVKGYAFDGPMFNIYHVSPHETSNPDEYVTEVCYPVRKL